MKASQKRFCLSGGVFAVLLLCTALVFRRVPSTELFYAVGVFGVLMSFLTVAWARIPKEDFLPCDGFQAIEDSLRKRSFPQQLRRSVGIGLKPSISSFNIELNR